MYGSTHGPFNARNYNRIGNGQAPLMHQPEGNILIIQRNQCADGVIVMRGSPSIRHQSMVWNCVSLFPQGQSLDMAIGAHW